MDPVADGRDGPVEVREGDRVRCAVPRRSVGGPGQKGEFSAGCLQVDAGVRSPSANRLDMIRANSLCRGLPLALLFVLSGCGVTATPAPTPHVSVGAPDVVPTGAPHVAADSGDPVGIPGGGSTGEFRDSIAPGAPFAFVVFIENRAAETAAVDGFELIDKLPSLDVLGAAAFPGQPNALGLGLGMAVSPDLASGVAARPLVGSFIGPKEMAGWTNGGALVFILRVPANGDYKVSGVRLRYRVGATSYVTDIPAALDVCAGAAVPTGGACPFR